MGCRAVTTSRRFGRAREQVARPAELRGQPESMVEAHRMLDWPVIGPRASSIDV